MFFYFFNHLFSTSSTTVPLWRVLDQAIEPLTGQVDLFSCQANKPTHCVLFLDYWLQGKIHFNGTKKKLVSHHVSGFTTRDKTPSNVLLHLRLHSCNSCSEVIINICIFQAHAATHAEHSEAITCFKIKIKSHKIIKLTPLFPCLANDNIQNVAANARSQLRYTARPKATHTHREMYCSATKS